MGRRVQSAGDGSDWRWRHPQIEGIGEENTVPKRFRCDPGRK